jgi:tyrosinase
MANQNNSALLSKPNISSYRNLLEGVPYTPEIGPHGGGHYVIR